jgi:hypothetical protein
MFVLKVRNVPRLLKKALSGITLRKNATALGKLIKIVSAECCNLAHIMNAIMLNVVAPGSTNICDVCIKTVFKHI